MRLGLSVPLVVGNRVPYPDFDSPYRLYSGMSNRARLARGAKEREYERLRVLSIIIVKEPVLRRTVIPHSFRFLESETFNQADKEQAGVQGFQKRKGLQKTRMLLDKRDKTTDVNSPRCFVLSRTPQSLF